MVGRGATKRLEYQRQILDAQPSFDGPSLDRLLGVFAITKLPSSLKVIINVYVVLAIEVDDRLLSEFLAFVVRRDWIGCEADAVWF